MTTDDACEAFFGDTFNKGRNVRGWISLATKGIREKYLSRLRFFTNSAPISDSQKPLFPKSALSSRQKAQDHSSPLFFNHNGK